MAFPVVLQGGALSLGLALVEVEGTDCPQATDVEARLRALLSPEAQALPRRGYLSRILGPDGKSSLRVEMRSLEAKDQGAPPLAERTLDMPQTEEESPALCQDLAAAAAVVLAAAWQEQAPTLPRIDPSAVRPISQRPPYYTGPVWEVSGSAFVSFTGATSSAVSGGACIEGFLAPPKRRLGGRLAFLGSSQREEPLGDGQVAWTRLALAAGPHYRYLRGSFVIGLHAETLLGFVLFEGRNFPQTYTGRSVDLGLGLGVRVGYRLGPVVPWVGGGVTGWLLPQDIYVEGNATPSRLPQLEMQLSLGISLGYPNR